VVGETERIVEYKATVGAVKTRLRLMGFTLRFVQADFEARKNEYLASLKTMMEDHPDLYREEVELLDASSFADFLSVLMASISLMPVQWRAYDDSLKTYQGEIGLKNDLKLELLRKAEAATKNRALIASQDWQDIRKLLDAIIDAHAEVYRKPADGSSLGKSSGKRA